MFKKIVFLLLIIVLTLSLILCKSPVGPEEDTVFRYRGNVKVTYIRNTKEIIFPEGNDDFTDIYFIPYDPQDPSISSVDGIDMEKVAENKFVGYIQHAFIQQGAFQKKHKLYIRDFKFYDGFGHFSTYRGEGITIEGAYEIEVTKHDCCFKMSAPDSNSSTFALFTQEPFTQEQKEPD